MKKFIFLMACVAVLMILFVAQGCKTTEITSTLPVVVTKPSDTTMLTVGHLDNYEIPPDRLAKLQLLTGPSGNTITLKKKWSERFNTIIDGRLIASKLTHIDSIIIKPFASGRLVDYSLIEDTLFLSVSFEVDSLYLVFKSSTKNPESGFILNTFVSKNSALKTMYGELAYNITANEAPKLFFVLDTKKYYDPKIRTVSGTGVDIQQPNVNKPSDQPTNPGDKDD